MSDDVLVTSTPAPLRERIQSSFTAVVAERGFHASALSAVADELGISKGTILHHFRSKEALLAQIGTDYIERRDRELTAVLAATDDPLTRLLAAIGVTVLCQDHDLHATHVFGREFARFAASRELEQVREERDAYALRFESVVAEAMRAGVIRAGDARFVTLQIFGVCNWTWTWYRPGGQLSIDEIARRHARVLYEGIAARDEDELVHDALGEAMRIASAASTSAAEPDAAEPVAAAG